MAGMNFQTRSSVKMRDKALIKTLSHCEKCKIKLSYKSILTPVERKYKKRSHAAYLFFQLMWRNSTLLYNSNQFACMEMNMYDSIIFDLDGTLWDTTSTVATAWSQVIESQTDLNLIITADDLKNLFGKPLPVIATLVFPNESSQRQQELIDLCTEKEHEAITEKPGTLYPDLEKVLSTLSLKYKLFIVSNCEAGYIELFLQITGFGKYFTDFECPGNTGLYKAENIKSVIKRNGLKSPIYIGDTSGDEEACEAAGVPFIFASYGFGKAQKPLHTIQCLNDLLNIF